MGAGDRPLRVTFLGTRGEIAVRSAAHAMHSALLLGTRSGRVMIDCGRDWRGRLADIGPGALLLTHAHADHSGGLDERVVCPVYATAETWAGVRGRVRDARRLAAGRSLSVLGLRVTALAVEHSVRAPAVAYRIEQGRRALLYAPDVAGLEDPARDLAGLDVYIGDGATLRRPLLRRRGPALIGHAPVTAQLDWCRRAGVRRAIFTHCGSALVRADQEALAAEVAAMGRAAGVRAAIAHDGLSLRLPP
jgi:phosphoribosyl 1,2-cyclic phosphodiesterase